MTNTQLDAGVNTARVMRITARTDTPHLSAVYVKADTVPVRLDGRELIGIQYCELAVGTLEYHGEDVQTFVPDEHQPRIPEF